MGVKPEDCRRVASWIGTKTFLNEFIAYDDFGQAINHTNIWNEHLAVNGSWIEEGPGEWGITLFNYYSSKYNSTYPTVELSHGHISVSNPRTSLSMQVECNDLFVSSAIV